MVDMVMVEMVTLAVLREARKNGAQSPVDYGDAEQIARAAIDAVMEYAGPLVKNSEYGFFVGKRKNGDGCERT